MDVYILDEKDYDNRGGQARPFRTLAAAQAAVPVAEWVHDVDEYEESWYGPAAEYRYVIVRHELGA